MLKRSWSIPAIALIAGTLLAITASTTVRAAAPKDELGVVTIQKGAPIIVGGMWVISGADTVSSTASLTVAATVTSFLFWLVLGAATGFLFQSNEKDRLVKSDH